MLNFDFLKKGAEIVFPPHFVYHFSRKMFLKIYPIKGTLMQISKSANIIVFV